MLCLSSLISLSGEPSVLSIASDTCMNHQTHFKNKLYIEEIVAIEALSQDILESGKLHLRPSWKEILFFFFNSHTHFTFTHSCNQPTPVTDSFFASRAHGSFNCIFNLQSGLYQRKNYSLNQRKQPIFFFSFLNRIYATHLPLFIERKSSL